MVNDVFLSNLVPHMYKSEFDDRAADFLSHYCKEALEKPMPVPIEDIAQASASHGHSGSSSQRRSEHSRSNLLYRRSRRNLRSRKRRIQRDSDKRRNHAHRSGHVSEAKLRNQEEYHRPRMRPLGIPQKILYRRQPARQ